MTTKEIADRALKILEDEGVEEWGTSHTETEVRVSWEGGRGDGWRIFAEMTDARLPVHTLRRTWRVVDGELTGPRWEIELRPGGTS